MGYAMKSSYGREKCQIEGLTPRHQLKWVHSTRFVLNSKQFFVLVAQVQRLEHLEAVIKFGPKDLASRSDAALHSLSKATRYLPLSTSCLPKPYCTTREQETRVATLFGRKSVAQ